MFPKCIFLSYLSNDSQWYTTFLPPQFQEIAKKSKKSGGVKATAGVERSSITRLQDRTLQEMTDEGRYVEEAGMSQITRQLPVGLFILLPFGLGAC